MRICALICVLMLGCAPPETVERNCSVRKAWYPDADGDGIGESTDIFIGCSAPEGWVDNVATLTTGTASSGTPAGDTADTGDTGP